MVVSKQYDIIDTHSGSLDRKIFVDPSVYEEELEKIFGRSWLFIGHESLIPNPNDFFLTYMGEDPVILTRDGKGELHAFLNMCRHRGNRIVRADDGNAKNFMCAYHGWTFSNEGKLVSVPGLQEAYYGELDVENLGLVSVAHLDTYAGMVFATWAEDAPTLEAYLGNMRYYMDIWHNRREGAIGLLGPDKWIIPNNWKNSADNFVGDMYHAVLSHRSAIVVMMKAKGVKTSVISDYTRPGNQVSAGNGHGGFAAIYDKPQDQIDALSFIADDVISEYTKSIQDEILTRLGPSRAGRIGPEHSTLFPNLSWLPQGTMRIWHPRGPNHTEVWSYLFYDKAMPANVLDSWRKECIKTFGPSGLLEQDDMDNWRNATDAGRSTQANKSRQLINMGVGHEHQNPDLPGTSVPNTYSEVNQRSFYVRWEQMMNATSWDDISVDPITAKFEGTAGMNN